MEPAEVHRLVQAAFEARDRAYAPYSNFHVGAALLAEDGTIIGGCNVENASYGAGICAERTAITKAVSLGHRKFKACVVTSQVPSPSVSPCGICRQVLREFLPLRSPIIMLSSTYPNTSPTPPTQLISALAASHLVEASLESQPDAASDRWEDWIKIMTLEELLPMSFGPEHLGMTQPST